MDIKSLVDLKPNPNIPDFRPGDSVRVHARVVEGDRQRIQAFEGVVLRIRRGGASSSFTVRRVSHGIGVERVFPYYSPLIEKVEVIRVGRVRRAKLYYLRQRVGKAARIKPGSRARFEELTAGRPVAEKRYPEEEEELSEEEAAVGETEDVAEEEAAQEELSEEEPAAEETAAESESEPAEEAAEAAGDGEEPAPEVKEETKA